MTGAPAVTDRSLLGRYAVFGAALAFAGPPIYIHTPALYAENHAMSLAAVGGVLLGLRMLDFIQDPLLGWFIARTRIAQRWLSAGFGLLLAIGALLLFTPEPLFDARWWLALSLVLVFTGFSALQIMFYSAGVGVAAARHQPSRHRRLAGGRHPDRRVGSLRRTGPTRHRGRHYLGLYGLRAVVLRSARRCRLADVSVLASNPEH